MKTTQGVAHNHIMSQTQVSCPKIEPKTLCHLSKRSLFTHPTRVPTENFFWYQMKGMAKIKLFYFGAMALILPRLKDITNFVLKLICSLFTFKCLRGDLYSSVIHHWHRQLKPY